LRTVAPSTRSPTCTSGTPAGPWASGGEGDRPVAKIYANRAALLKLREQLDRGLSAEEGMAAEGRYREANGAEYDLWVMRAATKKQMGEPREPERPDRSMFA
jgi:hypothetical protein